MGRYTESSDLIRSSEGDMIIDKVKDRLKLATAERVRYRAFLQKIQKVLASEPGDYKLEPGVAGGMSRFAGQPNTKETGGRIKDHVVNVLTRSGLVALSDLQVVVFPTSKESLAVIIQITQPDQRGEIILTATYDMRDNTIMFRNLG